MQSEERQYGDDYHHQPDEIDQSVHEKRSSLSATCGERVPFRLCSVLQRTNIAAKLLIDRSERAAQRTLKLRRGRGNIGHCSATSLSFPRKACPREGGGGNLAPAIAENAARMPVHPLQRLQALGPRFRGDDRFVFRRPLRSLRVLRAKPFRCGGGTPRCAWARCSATPWRRERR
jgi:hypothetical protein